MYTEIEVPREQFDRICGELVRWLAQGNDFFCVITDDLRCVQAAHSGDPDLVLHLEAVVGADDPPPRWPEGLRVTSLDLGQVIAYTSEVPTALAALVCRHLLEELPPPAPVLGLRLQGHASLMPTIG